MKWSQKLPIRLSASEPLQEEFPVIWDFHATDLIETEDGPCVVINYRIRGKYKTVDKGQYLALAYATGKPSKITCYVSGRGSCVWNTSFKCIVSKKETVLIKRETDRSFDPFSKKTVYQCFFKSSIQLSAIKSISLPDKPSTKQPGNNQMEEQDAPDLNKSTVETEDAIECPGILEQLWRNHLFQYAWPSIARLLCGL